MPAERIEEARRQIGICNACRYCEGYCSVFPAIHRQRVFADGDVVQLANLCHDCRGCYYACQYTEPHEFALNFPRALAEVRLESWHRHAVPSWLARAFQDSGVAIAAAVAIGLALLAWAIGALGARAGGEGFYAVLSHRAMVAIFAPAFLTPLAALGVSLARYWRTVGGGPVALADVAAALGAAAGMRNLAGGHGEGCNFEDEDRFSNARRWWHQAAMYGFALCFASTLAASAMHYALGVPAPYGLLSAPKLLGIPGGILLGLGTLGLAALKLRAERTPGAPRAWGGEMGFVVLLFVVAASGLALLAFGATGALTALLALHLGTVLALFVLMPYSKMAHGFYRLAALVKDAQARRLRGDRVAAPETGVAGEIG